MSQIPNTAQPPVSLRQNLQPSHVAAAILGVLMTTVLIIALALAVRSPLAGGRTVDPSAVTDGWMHGTAAISVSPAHSGGASDGWAGRYLPSAQAVNVTDGWAGRYLPSAQAVNVTDGWAGRYLH